LCWQEEHAARISEAATEAGVDMDAAIRMDLTHLTVFTIDSAETLEVDDGVSVEDLGDGKCVSHPTTGLPPC
jgi:exoribonuclease R